MQRLDKDDIADDQGRIDQENSGQDLFGGQPHFFFDAVSIGFFKPAVLQQNRCHRNNHDSGCNHRERTC